ncbi:hypothetical protein BDP27DRAFT_1448359 [Rhodocollybia butyracea]|uniref:Uncharacterized protein n=1 Tax=Rhodocollybia butyracea TaxID=206335 RepID=A0A9P5PTZ3_9AGAR|nr:hypothetical protein BDP27DRAFT_1448359 [Rhodocollybia butyracea]
MFALLPPELLRRIGNKTARLEDRKSLRLTCSLFGEAFQPHVLAEVTLNIHGSNLALGLCLLETLASREKDFKQLPSSDISKHIRTLYIDALSPSFSPESDADFERKKGRCQYTHEIEQQRRSWVKIEDRTSSVSDAEKILKSLLQPALTSLRCVDTIRWRRHRKDSEWVLKTVMNSISTSSLCSNIREFTLWYTPSDMNTESPIPLPDMCQVQTLFVHGEVSNTMSILALMDHTIISTASLTTVGLFCAGYDYSYPALRRTIPPNICNLGLDRFSFAIPQVVHNKLLSLEIGDVCIGDGIDDLWLALSLDQIHLRTLVVSHLYTTIDGLLDYLQSYSGLEVLSIRGSSYITPKYDDDAKRFYSDILPMHEQTLVKLEVKPVFESRWCFSPYNVKAFQTCRRLRSLWIKVDHKGLEPDAKQDAKLKTQTGPCSAADLPVAYQDQNSMHYMNSVHLLLDMISSSLPELEKLTIEPARSRLLAHDHADFMFGVAHIFGVRRRILASFKSFHVRHTTLTNHSDVLKWVKVYIGEDRLLLSVDRKAEEAKEISARMPHRIPILSNVSGALRKLFRA